MNSVDRLNQIMEAHENQTTKRPKHRRDTTPRVWEWLTPKVRSWLYGIILAVIPILGIYGYVDHTTAPLWVALAAAILGMSTAVAHMPSNSDSDDDQQ